MVIHTGVWIIFCYTIFLPDFIMPQLHFCSPCFLTRRPRTGLSLHLCVFSLVSDSFTFAAAAAADEKGNDDDASQHRHGDDQNLEVDPADPPSCISQRTHTAGGQDVPHRVVNALLGRYAPQTGHILQTLGTAAVGFQGTRIRSRRGALRPCRQEHAAEGQGCGGHRGPADSGHREASGGRRALGHD